MATPKLAVSYRPVDSLVPYARNARTHSEAQVAQLAASIAEFGWTQPILVDGENGVVAGHGRLLAARRLGMAQVPVIELRGLTEAQRRAYVLADNRLALDAGWDDGLLRLELADLAAGGFDLGLLGFSQDETKALLAPLPGAGLTDPDEAPPVAEVAVSRPGDVWVMGAHRLLCGDAQDPACIDALLGPGALIDAVWCDPPYNVDYQAKGKAKIRNDDLSDDLFLAFLGAMFRATFARMRPGAPIYVAHADAEGLAFRRAFAAAGFKLSGCLVWRKDSLVLGRSDYRWIHEPILYGWKPGAAHRWYGGRKQTTVQDLGDGSPFKRRTDGRWEFEAGGRILIVDGGDVVDEEIPTVLDEPKPRVSSLHPTMKPVALIDRMLRNSTSAGDVVYDMCGGSASTLIACERRGLESRLLEIDPLYVDVGVRRWQAFTGKDAVRESDGRAFNEVAK